MDVWLKRNDAGMLQADIDAPFWRQGDQLIRHIRKHFNARVISKAEAPDARSWELSIECHRVVVWQWDTGDVRVFSNESEGEALITKIANSVKNDLK